MIRIFVGYDAAETVAFNVLQHSLITRSSQPVSITPICLSQLKDVFNRPREGLQSTEFSFSRFLVPYLCGYDGWGIFMDNDFFCRADIAQLWALRDERYAVQVVQHTHVPTESVKFLNMPQSPYAKKNWSSMMLFNAAKCQALSPEYVEKASGLELHQFKWLSKDDHIGNLPAEWNHLVDVAAPNPEAKLVHFTLGGPYFEETATCEFAEEWFAERERMLYCMSRQEAKARGFDAEKSSQIVQEAVMACDVNTANKSDSPALIPI